MGSGRCRFMKRAEGVRINFLVGSMMLAFVRNMGPIPSHGNVPNAKLLQTYNDMEAIREQISETILDYLDAEEEEKVMREEKECK
jgi:hypothetical protein